MDFISRNALVAAMNAWVLDKDIMHQVGGLDSLPSGPSHAGPAAEVARSLRAVGFGGV